MSLQSGVINSAITVGGFSFSSRIELTAEGVINHSFDLPAGVAGAITAGGGVDGLATGHGFEVADIVDVHWTQGGEAKSLRGLVVATASANAVTFEISPEGEGDALPAEDTAVVVSIQTEITTAFDGDSVEILAVRSTKNAVADIRDSAGSELLLDLVANGAYWWANGQGIANPLASDTVASVLVSNASTEIATFYFACLYQSVE